MKIVHRIGIDPDKQQRELLKGIGIILPTSDNPISGLVTIELEEASDEYKKLLPFIRAWELFDASATVFTEEEISNSNWSIFFSPWANGYPMPEDNFGYLSTTYSDTDYCKTCGGGLIQKEPFRIKKEPDWGNKNMFSLNWVFDEVFVKKDFYERVLKQFDIESMPVLLYKKESVIENTVQLKLPVTDISLDLAGYDFETCSVCGRKRYNLINRGFFPPFKEPVGGMDFFKSKESFGTGANTRKYLFISKALREHLTKNKVKAKYFPCR